MNGPVDELYIACRRRDLKKILNTVNQEDLDAFYITEMARDVGKAARVTGFSPAGWRSVLKKNNVYQLKQKMV
jgi:hypothetical protein